MSPCEDAGVAAQLAELYRASREGRRTIEWRVNFGLWATIALVTAFFGKERPDLLSVPLFGLTVQGWLALVYVGVAAGYILVFQAGIQGANCIDRELLSYYTRQAETGLKAEDATGRDRGPVDFRTWRRGLREMWLEYSLWTAILTTAVVLLLSWLILSAAATAPATASVNTNRQAGLAMLLPTFLVACLTLAVASVSLFLMWYWRRPQLKVCVSSAAPVTRLRRFDTGGKRIKGNVVFEVAIYNKSHTTSNVEDVKAYEVTRDGALHEIGGGFYIGRVRTGRPDTRFDIPGRGRQILNYSGDDVELREWRDCYVFRVRVSDTHKKDWDGHVEIREVKKE